MTILISGEIDFPPEKREAALTGAKELIDIALAEAGCRHYAWSADPFDPGRVHVFEEWDTAQELEAHLNGEAYHGMLEHLSACSIMGAITRKYRCDLTEPVYGPDGVATATFLTATGER